MSSKSRPPESMDSLLLLCAHRVVAHHPLPAFTEDLPADLYPVLFQAAFLDRRSLVLRDLVATWPFTDLNFQQLVGDRELLRDHTRIDCIKAVIQGVVEQLQQELEEPGHKSSLRVLDMTGLPAGSTMLDTTKALAKAFKEVSKHQEEFQSGGTKRHKGCSGAATAVASPQPPGVDVHTDLHVYGISYDILFDVLQAGATGLLRLKCREFKAEDLSACEIVTSLESLDPSCLRRAELCCNDLGLTELYVILQQLLRFPELRSLKLQDDSGDLWWERNIPAMTIRSMTKQLGMLPSLRELKLKHLGFCGNLRHILGDLQAPLESLELDLYDLTPDDLTFLSQSFHAPVLKMLDLRQEEISDSLLEPLLLLLEKASASLLYLNLEDSYMDDSNLRALIPALLRCSRLRFLALYGYDLSTATLKDLLQKTLELPDLQQVVYPIPMDCRVPEPPDSNWNFVVDEERLAVVKAEFSQMLANSGRINLVWTGNRNDHRDLDYFSL